MQALKRYLPLISLLLLVLIHFFASFLFDVSVLNYALSFVAYLCVSTYITIHRDKLCNMNITRGYLFMFMLMPLVNLIQALILQSPWLTVSCIAQLAVAIVLFLIPVNGRPDFAHISLKKSIFWLAVSILGTVLVGSLAVLLIWKPYNFLFMFQHIFSIQRDISASFLYLNFFSFISIPLFFGFLWELFLKRMGTVYTIIILSALLSAHYLFPLFLIGLLLGWLTHKSKSLVYPTIVYIIGSYIFANIISSII